MATNTKDIKKLGLVSTLMWYCYLLSQVRFESKIMSTVQLGPCYEGSALFLCGAVRNVLII